MLEEPPLIVRMRASDAFMDDSFVIPQSERRQFRARGAVIRMKNTSNPQPFRDLDEHLCVFDIDYLIGRNPHGIEGDTKDINVGFSQTDEAGRNKKIHEPIQLKLVNPILIEFATFVADDDNLQSISCLKAAD
jgi:hypothetical protein